MIRRDKTTGLRDIQSDARVGFRATSSESLRSLGNNVNLSGFFAKTAENPNNIKFSPKSAAKNRPNTGESVKTTNVSSHQNETQKGNTGAAAGAKKAAAKMKTSIEGARKEAFAAMDSAMPEQRTPLVSSQVNNAAAVLAGTAVFLAGAPASGAMATAFSVIPTVTIPQNVRADAAKQAAGKDSKGLLKATQQIEYNSDFKQAMADAAEAIKNKGRSEASEENVTGKAALANAIDGNEAAQETLDDKQLIEAGLTTEEVFGLNEMYGMEALGLKPDNNPTPDYAPPPEQFAENNVAFNVPQMRM